MTSLAALAADTRTWPFEQARALQKRIERQSLESSPRPKSSVMMS